MQVRTMLLGTLLLAAGLAGCLGDDGGTGDGDAQEPDGDEPVEPSGQPGADPSAGDPAVRIENSSHQGTTMGAEVPGVTTFCVASCDATLEFEVEENVTAIVAEMAWNASDQLILDVAHPVGDQCEPVTPAGLLVDCSAARTSGQSPLRLEITDEQVLAQPGTWDARAFAERSPQPVEFTVWVSVVYGDIPLESVTPASS